MNKLRRNRNIYNLFHVRSSVARIVDSLEKQFILIAFFPDRLLLSLGTIVGAFFCWLVRFAISTHHVPRARFICIFARTMLLNFIVFIMFMIISSLPDNCIYLVRSGARSHFAAPITFSRGGNSGESDACSLSSGSNFVYTISRCKHKNYYLFRGECLGVWAPAWPFGSPIKLKAMRKYADVDEQKK